MLLKSLTTIAVILLAPLVSANPTKQRFVNGLDTGKLVPKSELQKAYKDGFVHLITRGYQELPKKSRKHKELGGSVDPNFLANYENARAVGLTVDAFWFPCSGGKHGHCKPYTTQVRELIDYIEENRMHIGRIWIDIEIDDYSGNWNYGRLDGGNLAEAIKIATALRDVYPRYGIYSTPGEWFNIFGNFNASVDPNAPLWWGTWDNKKTFEDMRHVVPAFGRFPIDRVVGKQYSNVSESYNNYFNLDVFWNP
jgi:hypothetical protein